MSLDLLQKVIDTKMKLAAITHGYLELDDSDKDLSQLEHLVQINIRFNKLFLQVMEFVLNISFLSHHRRRCDAA